VNEWLTRGIESWSGCYSQSLLSWRKSEERKGKVCHCTGRNGMHFIVNDHEAVMLFHDILGPHRLQSMEFSCTGNVLARSKGLSYVELHQRSKKGYVQNERQPRGRQDGRRKLHV